MHNIWSFICDYNNRILRNIRKIGEGRKGYMEEFLSEHGQTLISGIISVLLIILILAAMAAVGNMDEYEINSVIGK